MILSSNRKIVEIKSGILKLAYLKSLCTILKTHVRILFLHCDMVHVRTEFALGARDQ